MTCPLLIIGESYNDAEVTARAPFVGRSGSNLYRLLCEAGFPLTPIPAYHPGNVKMQVLWQASGIARLCVFPERPKSGKVDEYLAKKTDKDEDGEAISLQLNLPPLKPSLYLRQDAYHYINTLCAQVYKLKPNLIITLGNTATWAILNQTKIGKIRGTIVASPFGKVLPVYHPSAVQRNYEFRPIAIMDFMKAKREMLSPEFKRKRREVWIEPSIKDLYSWWEKYGKHSTLLSVDIETERATQISEIGFASDDTHALHLPFIVDRSKNYWKTVKEEVEAWNFVRMVCASKVEKLGQNFMYDMQFLWCAVGIPTFHLTQDTMLLHHALFPGMTKSLGFLGSVYCNEAQWKSMRKALNKDEE